MMVIKTSSLATAEMARVGGYYARRSGSFKATDFEINRDP